MLQWIGDVLRVKNDIIVKSMQKIYLYTYITCMHVCTTLDWNLISRFRSICVVCSREFQAVSICRLGGFSVPDNTVYLVPRPLLYCL